ncbi:MAG: DUF1800 family protein, partial [Pseudomonadota bacterium]|nr:DUF1800 family protein [Pseudomonadota bacterium]
PCIPYWFYWRMAWWDITMKGEDQLRQRVAQALSQIIVVSEKSELELSAFGLASFFDVLHRNAFGNFRDILLETTLHPAMGVYLSHLFNRKGDPAKNRRPDENFAREIMQLFSIGLFELNEDGTRKTDAAGNDIPTYDNGDIQELAKVFTCLELAGYYWPWDNYSATLPVRWDPSYEYNQSKASANLWTPMKMNERHHDQGRKRILKRRTLHAGQPGMSDIEQAIDVLFHHDNVGPFIGRQLIQRLVKSNPSPAYVARVSRAFADNGDGVRGDMQAVIRAILTDPEARQRDGQSQRVREPLLRYTQFMRAFHANNASGRLWKYGYQFDERGKQSNLGAPSVFNYYPPDFAPNGPLFDQDLSAPEFQLHDTASSVGYINLAVEWFFGGYFMEIFSEVDPSEITHPDFYGTPKPEDLVSLDLSYELSLASSPQKLVDHLDTLLAGGSLSPKTKRNIVSAIRPLAGSDDDTLVKYALLLVFVAPDYVVMS